MDARTSPRVAAWQAAVFTHAQAYDEGWSRHQVQNRLCSGRWVVVAGAALTARDQTIGPYQWAFAAVLTWPGAVVSHQVAGALHGFPVSPVRGTATVESWRHVQAMGLKAYRRRLDRRDITRRGDLLITTPGRTAIDLLGALPGDEARNLWAWLSTRRVLTLDELDRAVIERRGWTGTGQLRRLSRLVRSGAASPAEDALHRILRTGGIRGWSANVPIRSGQRVIAVADVLFEAQRLVIEVDGWATHNSRDAFARDRQRQNALVLAGFTVLRFTWDDLTGRPDQVLRAVRQALAA